MSRAIVSPVGQSATFVELFFDLVFVFGVTQLVGLLHHDLSWVGAGKTLLVFWLVWWGWTQFTWALNAADTTHPFVELGILIATAIAFFHGGGRARRLRGGQPLVCDHLRSTSAARSRPLHMGGFRRMRIIGRP